MTETTCFNYLIINVHPAPVCESPLCNQYARRTYTTDKAAVLELAQDTVPPKSATTTTTAGTVAKRARTGDIELDDQQATDFGVAPRVHPACAQPPGTS